MGLVRMERAYQAQQGQQQRLPCHTTEFRVQGGRVKVWQVLPFSGAWRVWEGCAWVMIQDINSSQGYGQGQGSGLGVSRKRREVFRTEICLSGPAGPAAAPALPRLRFWGPPGMRQGVWPGPASRAPKAWISEADQSRSGHEGVCDAAVAFHPRQRSASNCACPAALRPGCNWSMSGRAFLTG